MPQTEGAARAPTPDEVARVNILHADILSELKRPRLQDCADKLDAVLFDLHVSPSMREEAGRRILLCAIKLEDAGSLDRAISLLDGVRMDETLDLSLREAAGRRLLLYSLKLEETGSVGQAMNLLDGIHRDQTLPSSLREEASRLVLRMVERWSTRLNDLNDLGKLS